MLEDEFKQIASVGRVRKIGNVNEEVDLLFSVPVMNGYNGPRPAAWNRGLVRPIPAAARDPLWHDYQHRGIPPTGAAARRQGRVYPRAAHRRHAGSRRVADRIDDVHSVACLLSVA